MREGRWSGFGIAGRSSTVDDEPWFTSNEKLGDWYDEEGCLLGSGLEAGAEVIASTPFGWMAGVAVGEIIDCRSDGTKLARVADGNRSDLLATLACLDLVAILNRPKSEQSKQAS